MRLLTITVHLLVTTTIAGCLERITIAYTATSDSNPPTGDGSSTDCAAGTQDNDGDHTCTATCATAALNCLNGSCSDASGTAECICSAGYSGATCASCASGYQDNNADGTCAATCATAGLACVHGACSDASGTAECVCPAEYTGSTCASCAIGYQDNDVDGICTASCAGFASRCAAADACDDSTGEQRCITYPLDHYTPPTDHSLLRENVVMIDGSGIPSAVWGSSATDGRLRGAVDFASARFTYSRVNLTSCTGSYTPPNCSQEAPESGDAGDYIEADDWFYPEGAAFTYRWGDLRVVRAHFYTRAITSAGWVDCGFAFGFGSDVANPNASRVPKDLHLVTPTHTDASWHADQLRIMYRPEWWTSGDSLSIDVPMNVYPDTPRGMGIDNPANWSPPDFDVQRTTRMTANSDWIEFDLVLVFDHTSESLTITVTPTAASMSMTNWQSSTVVWTITSDPHNDPDHGGIDMDTLGLTYAELSNETTIIGHTYNGTLSECSVAAMQVEAAAR